MVLNDSEEPLLSSVETTESENPPSLTLPQYQVSSSKNYLPIFVKVCFLIVALLSVVYLVVTAQSAENSVIDPHQQFVGSTLQGPIYHHSQFHMPKDETYRYVLLYSDFYDKDRNWYLGTNFINDTYFNEWKCPQTKCIVTSNRTLLSGGIRSYDALLFFAHDKWDMPDYPPEDTRTAEQLYVVGMLETPPHTWRTFEKDHGRFNWTMSFRFESDVFWPYGYFVEKRTENVITPSLQPIWRQLDKDHFQRPFFQNQTLLDTIHGKRKMAAWFVSNCNLTPSKRMDVAKQMQKFISIDIYGKCGTLKCPKDDHDHCQQMLEKDYKFYLAFENSLCLDYITEKAFSNMNYHIIPVLYNAAENSHFLPPGSYLNVLDYSSIKELTEHMVYLSEHPEEYVKFFWWKEFYYIRVGYNFCDLCVKLHERNVLQRRQYYSDLDRWYRDSACIKTPAIPLE